MANFYLSSAKNSAFLTLEKVEGRKTMSRLSFERTERAVVVEEGSLAGLAEHCASLASFAHRLDFSEA